MGPRSSSRIVASISLWLVVGTSALANAMSSALINQARDAALAALPTVPVDARGVVAVELGTALIRAGRCPDALTVMRDTGAVAIQVPSGEIANAAALTRDPACMIRLAGILAQSAPPIGSGVGLIDGNADRHHLAGALLRVAGRETEGKALIRRAEVELVAGRPAPRTDMERRFAELQRRIEVTSGHSLADDNLWQARDGELQLYLNITLSRPPQSGALFRSTINQYADIALAAPARVPVNELSGLARSAFDLDELARAEALEQAALQRPDANESVFSLAYAKFDKLFFAKRYAEAAAAIETIEIKSVRGSGAVALSLLTIEEPRALLPYADRFDRWSGGDHALAATRLGDLAFELADVGATAEGATVLKLAVARLTASAPNSDDVRDNRIVVAKAAMRNGDWALAWRIADSLKSNPDKRNYALAGLATSAWALDRFDVASQALALIPEDAREMPYSYALNTLRRAPTDIRRRALAAALAYADQSGLRSLRVRAQLAADAAEQPDLADVVPGILARGGPPALLASATLTAAARARIYGNVALGLTLADAAARIASPELMNGTFAVDLARFYAMAGASDRGITVAMGIADPERRIRALAGVLTFALHPAGDIHSTPATQP